MKPTVTAVENDLRRLLKGDVEFDAYSRHLYATDGSIYQIEPLGVVSPRDTEDVAALVEYASERGVPLVPRGAGSGLAGAAVGAGIQVDFTRYMNRVLEISEDGTWARVQPGLIMGELNKQLRPYGTFFAPNPSSENYCSLGGMMANNSSGSRSVAYGDTKDHVLSLDVVLHGGETFHASPVRRDDPAFAGMGRNGRGSRAFARILPLLEEKQEVIARSVPRVVKNASGYRVESVLDDDEAHLQKLFVGSEGTLGMITEATLNLVPLPGRRAIGMAYFPNVFSAGEAVFPILDLKPTSLEIMDSNFLGFVRRNDPRIDALLPDHADTALLVEFEARGEDVLAEKLRSLEELLAGGDAIEVRPALDAEEQEQLWTVRRSAVPLLQKLPGPRRIVEFIEDVTVHPDVLASYMSTLAGILERHEVEGVLYGHAGDGNIHTRPLLDVKDAGDLRTMQTIMTEVMEYVQGIRGTPSGEHGDGLVRSPYVRRFYGDEVYGVFEEIKTALDPAGIFNAGKKIVHEAESGGVARHLRYGPDYWTYEQPTLMHFPDREFEREIEKCHGCAQCKSTVATTMCPTYKATRREHASPRAKANLLRNAIQGKLDPASTYAADLAKDITDYCIECGMCALECPSNVNIPKLMLEAKSRFRYSRRATPTDLILGHPEYASRVGSRMSPLANRLTECGAARVAGELVAGIDRRRDLPMFSSPSYESRMSDEESHATPGAGPDASGPGVAFFRDLHANYHDPELGETIERLLQAHKVAVEHPSQKASGVPEMLYGFYRAARRTARYNVENLLPAVRRGRAIVTGEPTASFALKIHYPDYLGTEDASAVADSAHDLGEYLAKERRARAHPRPAKLDMRVAYHLPCHLKAQSVGAPFLGLLREVPGLELHDLDAGCCGMAGTFGMKKDTFVFSMETGRPLFERIGDLRPEMVATECSTCALQIGQATGMKTIHPARLLARAYGV